VTLEIRLILLAVLAVGLLVGINRFLAGQQQIGYDRCKAEDIEAARMDELRARNRIDTAAGRFEAKRATNAARERTVAPEVARVVAGAASAACFDDGMLGILARDAAAQGGAAGEPASAVRPSASSPAR